MAKVVVGMSGGVDSSVTAYLLRKEGFEVEGVSFLLWDARRRCDLAACCSLESASSASKTAKALGIMHSSVDVRKEFIECVIEPFVAAYAEGLTPNPCILCNRHIKFPYLIREADRRGAEYIATGHYAGILRRVEGGSARLLKGTDPAKDQSYVLYVLSADTLGRLVLPLGGYLKAEVREIARSLGLAAAERPESQEICFIEDDDYVSFIRDLSPDACREGPIKDGSGKVVGTHQGLYRYTLGQRKGIGLARPDPSYVTGIDISANTLFVGPRSGAERREIGVSDLNWIIMPEPETFRATVKVRSMMKGSPASVEVSDGIARVVFDTPQWAPAPGQSAVFYDGDSVIGGGIINAAG